MTNVKLTIKAATVGACVPAISKEQARYYLGGVFIEPQIDGGVICVATDGHRMIVAQDESAQASGIEPRGQILSIPKTAVKFLKNTATEKHTLVIEGDTAKVFSSVVDGEPVGEIHRWKAEWIDGTFPDWRHVMPKVDGLDKASSAFNADYIADFAKVAKAYGAKAPGIRVFTNCDTPALVRFINFDGCLDVFAVLMPLRDETSAEYPEWIKPESQYSQAAE